MARKLPVNLVKEFHKTYGLPVRNKPQLPGWDQAVLRQNLLLEETSEYVRAVADEDLVEIADALADIVYVAYGAALTYGIDLDAVLEEVHRSNMSKLGEDGKPIYREEDGKVLKGPNYFPPDIGAIINGKNGTTSREA